MVTHVNNDSVFKLTGVAKSLHDASKLVINLFDHCIVISLDLQRVVIIVSRRNGVMAIGRNWHNFFSNARVLCMLRLLVNGRKSSLPFNVRRPKPG